MVVVRLGIRLRFTKVPGVQGERVFRDTMTVTDPHDYGYQGIKDVVEKKLRFMDVPPCDFTVFHRDSKTGDTIVVDDPYWGELLTALVDEAAVTATGTNRETLTGDRVDGRGEEEEEGGDEPIVEKAVSFDVEVHRERPLEPPSSGGPAGTVMPLTSEALQAHTTDGVCLPIAALTCPPKYPRFFHSGCGHCDTFQDPKAECVGV
ncbi:hypothetical protein TraAM80_00553 [Trypanosoma rangeli]|uniref:Uncharacterized protein n=1 Tax=Trypanosoma rangeli TaxID=5698 RepID=A0A3R7MVL9_TRYRA|nr:uncharacterized protein TraAM80_00553 [Trypanosoma rangeli]RNF11993.1 hypothetical protein TraAM80_00553 [Trypanosoma rangeli]|eukprot:RNF11993.1 hypothetical protein TraAM80_00553 [Trypanosoma rangeli]